MSTGEFAGDAVAYGASAIAAAGEAQIDPHNEQVRTGAASSTWLWIVYALGDLVLAWAL